MRKAGKDERAQGAPVDRALVSIAGHAVPGASGGAERRLRALVLVVVMAAHGVAVWALARSEAGRRLLDEAVPLMVSLVQPDQPPPQKPRVHPPVPRPRSPAPAPILQAAQSPAPAVVEAPPSRPAPLPPPSAPVVAAAPPVPPVVAAPAPPVTEPVVPPSFNAAYLNNPPPEYPRNARRNREQGRVMVRVLVNEAGRPDRIELGESSGSASLDQAALDVVRQWRFVPARRGQTPVGAWVLVPIVFRLDA